MTEETLVNVSSGELRQLIQDKLQLAGLSEEQAVETAKHLVHADLSGIHSHGAVRVEYYAERIKKGGITLEPNLKFEKRGPSAGIFYGDNAQGQYVAYKALEPTIAMAKETGVAVVGVANCGHTGILAYYLEELAKENLLAISMTQSDPMAVPFGGTEAYYGTNPIGFGAPSADGEPLIFDMATTVQAWGKILDARSKNQEIPDSWAVDAAGNPTTDPHQVAGLLPIAGPKGYGLMMMVDIFSGVLLGLPFGKRVSSMYEDLSKGRDLGQLYIVIDPERFAGLEVFKRNILQTKKDLNQMPPAEGFEGVQYPGQGSKERFKNHLENGIMIPEELINYLRSDAIHFDHYEGMGAFAN